MTVTPKKVEEGGKEAEPQPIPSNLPSSIYLALCVWPIFDSDSERPGRRSRPHLEMGTRADADADGREAELGHEKCRQAPSVRFGPPSLPLLSVCGHYDAAGQVHNSPLARGQHGGGGGGVGAATGSLG